MSSIRTSSAASTIVVAAVSALLASCVSASAQDGIGSMVFMDGHCTRFVVGTTAYPSCKGIVYAHFKNGRVGLNIATQHDAIMLSGGSDSQLDPKRYVFNVDRIRVGGGSGESQGYPARGRCEIVLKDIEGKYVKSVTCRASNGIEAVSLDFIGSSKPVEIVQ